MLGVRPVLGRNFSADEEQPGKDQVAVISHNLWHRNFAADPNLVGRPITLDGKTFTIVGVMPEGFQFPGGSGTVLRIFT
ncbi:MAG: ABC transporter permease, partial [Pyrinomonadaceae bacterium]